MPIDLAPLRRAGLTTSAAEVETLLQAALERAIPPYPAPDARRALSSGEIDFLRGAGVDLDQMGPPDPDEPAPELRTAALGAGLLATSLSVGEAAKRLGVDASRIRQRLGHRTLYGIRSDGEWRLPLFQFTDDGARVIPGVGDLAPHLTGLHPVDVAIWFTAPDQDLVRADGEALSPRDWLLGGGDPAPLAPLVQELHGVA